MFAEPVPQFVKQFQILIFIYLSIFMFTSSKIRLWALVLIIFKPTSIDSNMFNLLKRTLSYCL